MKEVNIKIAIDGTSYDIVVAGGTPQEKKFHTDDGVIGLRARLTAIADAFGQYVPADELPKDEPAKPATPPPAPPK